MKLLKWGALAAVAALSFFGGGWLLRRGIKRGGPSPAPVLSAPRSGDRLFEAVLSHIKSFAVDSLEENGLYRLATSGMLTELGDPYATLVSSRDTARLDQAERAQGAYLDLVDDFVTVVAISPGSPAAQANLRAGDVVLRIDDTPTERMRPETAAGLIDGKPGTVTRLRVDRTGVRTPLFLTLTRGAVPPLPPPSTTSLGGGITYLRLFRVDRAAGAAAEQVVDSLTRAGGRALVLDLRGVVEGRLEDAVALADDFLDRGQSIVTSRGRQPADSTTFVDERSAPNPDLALVVLVDRGTAGAAEVVAGALQDHDRAVLIGEATFGRGARQSLFPVGPNYVLRLTTSHWITPSGRMIQRPAPVASDQAPASDSAPPRPKYRTESGRTVLGGGGIVPDREVALGGEEPAAGDPALVLARQLLNRAKDRKTLIAALAVN